MRNADRWRPSKYVHRRGKLCGSRDRNEIAIASRLAADVAARFYDRILEKYAKGRLLDLGCGKVPLFAAYKQYISESICVDWENTPHGSDYVDIKCDLTEGLPFLEGEFDTILLSDVLEHVFDPHLLWREMHRVLASGGRVIANVPFYYWLHEQPHDYYRYTEFALRRLVAGCGLEVAELETAGGSPEILADICAKHLQAIPWFGANLAIGVQGIAFLFLKTRLGKSISRNTGRHFPFGYFLVATKP